MAPSSKLVVLLLAMTLMVATVHGCDYNCQNPPSPPPPSTSGSSCPNLEVCVDLLRLPVLRLNVSPNNPCCKLLGGLAGLDAAACLCDVVDVVSVIGLDVSVDIIALLNKCNNPCPSNYTCRR